MAAGFTCETGQLELILLNQQLVITRERLAGFGLGRGLAALALSHPNPEESKKSC
jgi:hypothetical protein